MFSVTTKPLRACLACVIVWTIESRRASGVSADHTAAGTAGRFGHEGCLPATFYKVWAVGPPVGQGATGSVHVGVAGIAKAATPNLPYTVPNELVCTHLARLMMLPIPPSFLIEKEGKPHHVSLDFNLAGQSLPPVDAAAMVAAHPKLAVGIIVFDAWVFNHDRNATNVAFDTTTNKVQIFDHSHALLHGSDENAARNHFETHKRALNIGNHCLANEIKTFDGVHEWLERMRGISKWHILHLVEQSVAVGFPRDLAPYTSELLLERRSILEDLIQNEFSRFPNAQPYPWHGGEGGGL